MNKSFGTHITNTYFWYNTIAKKLKIPNFWNLFYCLETYIKSPYKATTYWYHIWLSWNNFTRTSTQSEYQVNLLQKHCQILLNLTDKSEIYLKNTFTYYSQYINKWIHIIVKRVILIILRYSSGPTKFRGSWVTRKVHTNTYQPVSTIKWTV